MSVSVPTRVGPPGTADKLALMHAEALKHAQDPRLRRLALKICQGRGSRATRCVQALDEFAEKIAKAQSIEAWASQLEYRYEFEDDLRHPLLTSAAGGDCDDMVVLVGALLISLGIAFEPEIVADDQCVAFHVRAVAGLPPARPTKGYAIDPVKYSERLWHSEPDIPASRQTAWRGPR